MYDEVWGLAYQSLQPEAANFCRKQKRSIEFLYAAVPLH